MWEFGYNMIGSGWGWLMGAVLIILIVLALVLVFRMVPRHKSGPLGSSPSEVARTSRVPMTPRQVLEQRYASGDITTEEFHERLQNLRSA